jgi:hypothetical protein
VGVFVCYGGTAMIVLVDLNDDQMDLLMHDFIDIDRDDPPEDEAFRRTCRLFNKIYRLGQQEALRVVARGKNTE